MPFALFGDAHILLELPLLIILLTYGVASRDFGPFVASIILLGLITSLQIVSSEQAWQRMPLILLAPVTWWLLLVITAIELYALAYALWSMYRGVNIPWQKWKRVGLSTA